MLTRLLGEALRILEECVRRIVHHFDVRHWRDRLGMGERPHRHEQSEQNDGSGQIIYTSSISCLGSGPPLGTGDHRSPWMAIFQVCIQNDGAGRKFGTDSTESPQILSTTHPALFSHLSQQPATATTLPPRRTHARLDSCNDSSEGSSANRET